jgi:hypothetical protein
MDSNHFDALTRIASSSRRITLAGMLAAAGGLATLTTGEAKQKGQDCGKKARQRCNADAETCRTLILSQCQAEPASCQAQAACCAACSADGLLNCVLALQTTMAAARLT